MSDWILILDTRGGRLLEVSRTPNGRRHLQERALLALDEREFDDDPQRLAPRISRAGRAAMDPRRRDLQRQRLLARQLADWMADCLQPCTSGPILTFCPTGLSGQLRSALEPRIAERLLFRKANLAHLPYRALLEHRAVIEALETAHLN